VNFITLGEGKGGGVGGSGGEVRRRRRRRREEVDEGEMRQREGWMRET